MSETATSAGGNCRILQGTVFDRLPDIEPGSIDCAVTSPPYWMLRSYLPKGHPLKHLELGQEPTPAEYVANVVRWCGLVRNALADHGTLWLNVGDTYSGSGRGGGGGNLNDNDMGTKVTRDQSMRSGAPGIPAGNLCLIPQRLMIALQDDGWLVRSVVVWHKPAAMPCSVTGWLWKRCRVKKKAKAFSNDPSGNTVVPGSGRRTPAAAGVFPELDAQWSDCPGCKKCSPSGGYVLRKGSWRPTSSWEPVIMLAKTANYFCDGEAVKTPPKQVTVGRDKYSRVIDDPDEQCAVAHDHETTCDDGANLRDVWTISFEPLNEAHYAAYPTELVHKCLAAGTSAEGYCDKCGGPFVRVVEHKNSVIKRTEWGEQAGNRTAPSGTQSEPSETRTVGWRASCKCPNPTPRPGRVLDPFCGSGRTGIVARRLGLDFTGVELNPDFVDMGKRLVTADQPLFNDFAQDAA